MTYALYSHKFTNLNHRISLKTLILIEIYTHTRCGLMPVKLTDAEINALIQERKRLPEDFISQLKHFKDKFKHKESELALVGDNGSRFTLVIRQSKINVLDFSVILFYTLPSSNVPFRLMRCNGKSHRHRNKLENFRLSRNFHIHKATERYQRANFKEEDYAVETDKYADLNGAVRHMLRECNFINPNGGWIEDFGERGA